MLHPPRPPSCESISQSTILHNISFEVRVTIGLVATPNGGQHQNRDCIVSRTIYIVPDYPPTRADKQKEVEPRDSIDGYAPSWISHDGPVPEYVESNLSSDAEYSGTWTPQPPPLSPPPHQGSSTLPSPPPPPIHVTADSSFEEEYDGYEDISATLASLAPPPAIDEDVSPPSPSATGSSAPPHSIDTSLTSSSQISADRQYETDQALVPLQFVPLGETSSPSIPSSPSSLAAANAAGSSGDASPLVLRPIYCGPGENIEPVDLRRRGQEQNGESALPPPYAGRNSNEDDLPQQSRSALAERRRATRQLQQEQRNEIEQVSRADEQGSEHEEVDEEATGPPPEYSSYGDSQHVQPGGAGQSRALVGVVRDGELVGVLEQRR